MPTSVSGKAIVSPSSSFVITTDARYSRFTWCTIPVPGGTTLKLLKACWPQRNKPYLSLLRSYSRSTLRANARAEPNMSTCTEWSITRSAGTSGLIFCGFPPIRATAERMAARSATAGTPVKSCKRTRAGMNGYSTSNWDARPGTHRASDKTVSSFTFSPPA